MTGKSYSVQNGRCPRWLAGALLLAAWWLAPRALAQTALTADPPGLGKTAPAGVMPASAGADGNSHEANLIPSIDTSKGSGESGIIQAGCAGCGGNGAGSTGCGCGAGTLCGPGELGSGGCGSCCLPGRNYCCSGCDDCKTQFGRLLCGFYQCVCCPDPCYDPCWMPVADTAFFVDAARPVTQMRFQYDDSFHISTPDRAEYFLARDRTTPNQLEPGGPCAKHGFGKGLNCIPSSINLEELKLYTEAAQGAFSLFTEIPYLEMDPQTADINAAFTMTQQQTTPTTMPTTGVLNNNLLLAQDFTLTTPVTLPPTGMIVNQPIALPAGTMLPGGAILANGQSIPATPPAGLAAPLVLPAGSRILGATAPAMGNMPARSVGATLPAGTVLSKGTQLPATTDLMANMIPMGGAAMVTTVPVLGNGCCGASGFGDIVIGTKSMLLDCCLMQITFEFKTFLPAGNFTAGLGTGHVSLEPSILWNVNCAKDTYFQSQFAYWIPIGGDALYEGNIFHMHMSLNHVLWRPCPGVQIVGSAELSEYSVLGGAYTDTSTLGVNPANGQVSPVSRSARGDFVSAGPGARLFICDKIDFGVGTQFSLTNDHFLPEEEFRVDFRWRY